MMASDADLASDAQLNADIASLMDQRLPST